jgi:hypothetical protein
MFGLYVGIMRTLINKRIRVLTTCEEGTDKLIPHLIRWEGRTYKVIKKPLCHPVKEGVLFYNVFSTHVMNQEGGGCLDMIISYNNESRQWFLIHTENGMP